MEAAMGLMRRIPPKHTETPLSALLSLLPDHSSHLLSQVDQPLQVLLSHGLRQKCLSSVLYLESSSREKFKDKIAWRFPGKKCMGGLNTSIIPADLIERILGEQVQIARENSTNVMLYRIALSII
ncbi:hypothetical protein ACSBR1_017295 [Camellia fascicularis]